MKNSLYFCTLFIVATAQANFDTWLEQQHERLKDPKNKNADTSEKIVESEEFKKHMAHLIALYKSNKITAKQLIDERDRIVKKLFNNQFVKIAFGINDDFKKASYAVQKSCA